MCAILESYCEIISWLYAAIHRNINIYSIFFW